VEALAANTPAWHSRTCFEYAGLSGLDIPVVNIGPWGRDYHQRIERVFTPYAFQTLPELLWQIAMELMHSEGSGYCSTR